MHEKSRRNVRATHEGMVEGRTGPNNAALNGKGNGRCRNQREPIGERTGLCMVELMRERTEWCQKNAEGKKAQEKEEIYQQEATSLT